MLGEPERVTTPSASSAWISFSGDGRRIAYVDLSATQNLHKVAFDPSLGKIVGPPLAVTTGSRIVRSPDLSPDGQWLAFTERGKQEDIFVMRADGTGLRQLTDDIHKDRWPAWSPDGKKIAFYSNRSGEYQIWTINPDGSGIQQITYVAGEDVLYPRWSPDDKRLVYSNGRPHIIEMQKPWKEQSPQPLPPLADPNLRYEAWSWSPDGRRLAGHVLRADGAWAGVVVYSLVSQQYLKLTDLGGGPVWLKDGRRLLFAREDKLYLVDSESKKVQEVPAPLAFSPGFDFALSQDNRSLYLTIRHSEGDIWVISLAK